MDFEGEARKLIDGLDRAFPNRLEFAMEVLRDVYRAGAHAGLGQANRMIRGEEAQPAELGIDA